MSVTLSGSIVGQKSILHFALLLPILLLKILWLTIFWHFVMLLGLGHKGGCNIHGCDFIRLQYSLPIWQYVVLKIYLCQLQLTTKNKGIHHVSCHPNIFFLSHVNQCTPAMMIIIVLSQAPPRIGSPNYSWWTSF